jgi:hypothetical protein
MLTGPRNRFQASGANTLRVFNPSVRLQCSMVIYYRLNQFRVAVGCVKISTHPDKF